jgi:hypothetical protein
MKNKVSSIAIFFTIMMVASSHVLAKEVADVDNQKSDLLVVSKHPQRPPWEFSADTTWLPGSTIQETVGDISINEVKTGFTRRFRINPEYEISTGLHYSLREIDAPETANLPESLQTLSINLGGEYRANDTLTLGIRISPVLSSDGKSFATNDLRVPIGLHTRYYLSKALTLFGGVAYTGQSRAFPVFPFIGVLYLPTEKWAFAFGFPRTGITFKQNKEIEYFIAAEFSGGEYRLHDSSYGADIISYRDYRALAGADIRLFPFVKLGIHGGYAFARKFVFYEGSREDINLDNAPFGRLEIKFAW